MTHFFIQTADTTGKDGGSADKKNFAGMQKLTESIKAMSFCRETNISEQAVSKCLKRFNQAVVALYRDEWLRLPSEEEMKKIKERYRQLRFPGCFGAVDFSGWT